MDFHSAESLIMASIRGNDSSHWLASEWSFTALSLLDRLYAQYMRRRNGAIIILCSDGISSASVVPACVPARSLCVH